MRLLQWVSLLAVVLVAILFVTAIDHITYAGPDAAPRMTGYDLSWYTVDGASVTNLSGGTFALNATLGQYEAGSERGGIFADNGGFWMQVDLFGYSLSLPLVLR